MEITKQYTEITGITHAEGEEQCHDLMPKIKQLEILLKKCEDDFEECAGAGMDLDMKCKDLERILSDPFPHSIYPQLSQLERNIAKMTVIDGMTAQEIADALGSSKSTVNSYRRTVFKASGARPHEWAKVVFDRIQKVLGGE